ncbi:phosphomethylpyrimidine synthase ThiC [Holdemanella biformis]|uniref:phosphomethylpyrimidine synthase ThiC n=1 Tax=Holdemanella biformis TaxID=1735 RepID=UPI002E79E969|nr:phosphomethylpyrimidine synthase ThiC [Holdemanella biformis]MEE0396187.1 phosphomethylpyrimidine synthase ThiC [Holdemanella biformis]
MNTNESTVSTGATYTTQMDAARKGIITPEMKIVAQKEKMTEEELRVLVACGKVVIPANKNHKSLDPEGVGSMLRTKINVNLGVSRDCKDYDVEMKKVMAAVDLGAESIMDLSSHGNTQPFRQKLTSECPAMIGTVPVYDSVIHYQRDLNTLTAKDFLDVIELYAKDGVDFVTLHCGITRKTIDQIKKHKRKMNIVSRGGSLVFAWMSMTGEENPFYEYYDEILDICEKYDVTISLGDACRPGCLADATDVCQIEELVRLGELTKRAWDHNVQVIVEGPGHVPLNQVAANMQVQQQICMGAPFYVLGPLVTDIAPGYDHITAAIGGAVAAMSGAAFLCYVTPAEHLALPNVEDTKQGIIASKIAAHAADIAKGVPGARDIDDKMADARKNLDWDAQFECALDPETAKAIRQSRMPEEDHSDTCSMCGKFCAVRSMNKALSGENIDIL